MKPLIQLPALLAAVLLGSLTLSAASPAARKPNILIIVADDLGYGELSCQGFTPQIPTPNIDSIAKNGVRFTSGYVSGPYCSPTRAGLLTGRYQQRFGYEFNPGPAQFTPDNVGLPVSEKTIGDRFKAAGYATGWMGKQGQRGQTLQFALTDGSGTKGQTLQFALTDEQVQRGQTLQFALTDGKNS